MLICFLSVLLCCCQRISTYRMKGRNWAYLLKLTTWNDGALVFFTPSIKDPLKMYKTIFIITAIIHATSAIINIFRRQVKSFHWTKRKG